MAGEYLLGERAGRATAELHRSNMVTIRIYYMTRAIKSDAEINLFPDEMDKLVDWWKQRSEGER